MIKEAGYNNNNNNDNNNNNNNNDFDKHASMSDGGKMETNEKRQRLKTCVIKQQAKEDIFRHLFSFSSFLLRNLNPEWNKNSLLNEFTCKRLKSKCAGVPWQEFNMQYVKIKRCRYAAIQGSTSRINQT